MKQHISIKEIIIIAVLTAIFIIVYFFSFIEYSKRMLIMLIAICLIAFVPAVSRNFTIKFSSCRLIWAFAICIALIEMTRCRVPDLHGYLYFICILLFLFTNKTKCIRCFKFSENVICIMGGVFAGFTLISYYFTDFYKAAIVPMMRINDTYDIVEGLELGKYSGLTNQASINAVYIGFGVGACFLSMLFSEKKDDKLKLTILLCVEWACIILTLKRGPFIYSILSILLIYYYNSKRGKKITSIIRIVFSLVAIVYIISNFFPSVNLLLTSFMEGKSLVGDFSNGRTVLYEAAWNYFQNNKAFGIGWTNFRYFYMRYIDVHNIYLQLLCETGLIGAIPFYIAFLYTFILSVKKMNQLKNNGGLSYRLILFSLFLQTFFLLHGMSSNALYDYFISFFYFLAVIICDSICVDGDGITI